MFAPSLAADVKPEYLRLVQIYFRWNDNGVWIMFEEHMRETRAKVSAIDINAAEFWKIHFLAPRAVHFKSRSFQSITQTYWQHFLLIAKSARAKTVHPREVLLVDLCKPTR